MSVCFFSSGEDFCVIALRAIPDVFELTIESFFLNFSILANVSCLTSNLSKTASMIQSASPRRSKLSSVFPIVMSWASLGSKKSAGLAFKALCSPALTMRFLTVGSCSVSPLAFSSGASSLGTMSNKCTLIPTPASSAAIPLPIVPAPKTAAVLMSRIITCPLIFSRRPRPSPDRPQHTSSPRQTARLAEASRAPASLTTDSPTTPARAPARSPHRSRSLSP
ncbi:hypothetical protein HRbin07_00692 [bacterium HR07]|nr:hypothetical protein HRbin07_00692 [bacterium HR07]